MFCYQEKVNAGVPQVCTPEKWDELIDSPEVKNICKQIAELDPNAEGYNDRKQALKKRLPIIIPHAASFKNNKRISADAIPSGLAMLDVDHVENPVDWFVQLDKKTLADEKIYLVAITASGKGLRIIGERLPNETIEAAQLRMAQALGITEYDAVTKDLARASYVVPRSYILWMDTTELFANKDRSDLLHLVSFLPALPPHVNQSISPQDGLSAQRSISDNDLSVAEGDGLYYRGIPYADIIDQLLIATGNGGGAEVGERNTVYFSLANYMRYICDFNADLLLQILPDFGLSEAERRQAIYRYLRKRVFV